MSQNRVNLDDQTLCSLYGKFQEARRSIGRMYPLAVYDDFIDRGRYQGIALPMTVIAPEHMLTATNSVNRFNYDLHNLSAWNEVFSSIDEEQRWQATFEFTFLIASQCLSTPYSIKQMLIKLIYEISHHTSRFWDDPWDATSLKPRPNFPDAKKLAQRFVAWTALEKALSMLNSEDFVTASDNYRNRLNHGAPQRIEIGHLIAIVPDLRGSCTYVMRHTPPLMIGDAIPVLSGQYAAALRAYNAFVDLIKEQERLWPRM
jgi:hypothetical protein